MSEQEDTEPQANLGAMHSTETSVKSNKNAGLSKLRRELSAKDLNDSGAKKMLLNLLDTLSLENEDLKGKLSEFYRKDKELAVLRANYQGLKINVALKNIFSNVGFLILGLLPYLYDKNVNWVVMVMALCLGIFLISIPHWILKKSGRNAGGADEIKN